MPVDPEPGRAGPKARHSQSDHLKEAYRLSGEEQQPQAGQENEGNPTEKENLPALHSQLQALRAAGEGLADQQGDPKK